MATASTNSFLNVEIEGSVRTFPKTIRLRSPLTTSGRQLSTTECQELCTVSVIFVLRLLVVYKPHLDWAFSLVYESRHTSGDGQLKRGCERLLVRVIVLIGVAWRDAFALPFARWCTPAPFSLHGMSVAVLRDTPRYAAHTRNCNHKPYAYFGITLNDFPTQ